MDSPSQLETARRDMLSKQLKRRGITDRRVLEAMSRVPRERFVSQEYQSQAYSDRALPIDHDQTISQPYIVALMTQALSLTGAETVLEVGTGSGYQAAVLAELASRVISIERHRGLSEKAGRVLAELGTTSVHLVVGDGSLGWPETAPYDRIIVTAATAACPPALLEQLREGGRLVIPIGDSESQVLEAIVKTTGGRRTETLSGCRFVPLIGDQAWPSAGLENDDL